ncbi:hypothetical protein RchiOBHm_Chr7g0184881 [Rosa chinensis]|uniref:Uncharacterized protein n=1 Tax=Rosa chinensis TaxID=74649 RepID=A0A2P6P3K4_ROSCH|nr:hypothetical protein RchiOBHm_Chr7g0184881 [Rosa chinensis]
MSKSGSSDTDLELNFLTSLCEVLIRLLNISLRSVMDLLCICFCCFQVQLSEKSFLLEKTEGEITELAEKVNEK